jgi:quinol monooxygenase YgiN
MLIVTGRVEIKLEGLINALKAVQAMVAQTCQEPGCRVYEFSQVIGAQHMFRIYEEWDDEAALTAHFATPHMATFRAALAQAGVVSREVFKIEGGQKSPLG